jgi:hypothetical protein
LRLEQAAPILNDIKEWLDQSIKHAVPKSTLGNAFVYIGLGEQWNSQPT